MGKRITTQKRGRGSARMTAQSQHFKTEARYAPGQLNGKVTDIIDDPSRTGVVMIVRWDNGKSNWYLAPEGTKVTDPIAQGTTEKAIGNILKLADIPEGMPIFNIEGKPGDGGKAARASGASAYIVAKKDGEAMVRLPSRAVKAFNEECRAMIGVSAGGGRPEKPMVKAGANFYKLRRGRKHLWPSVRGVHMNPCDHPHGGKQHHLGYAGTVARDTPPGAKVGHIAAKRTGRRKR